MRRSQRFREETFSRFRIAPQAQEKFQGISLANPQHGRGTSTLFSLSHTSHRRATSRLSFEMRAAAFLQFGCILLYESGRWWCGRCAILARSSSLPDLGN